MKKLFSILSALFIFIFTIQSIAAEESFTYITRNGEITITGTGLTGEIVIPEEINGLPVTEIRMHAFDEAEVTSITLPKTVNSLGEEKILPYAPFLTLDKLESITVDEANTNYFSDENGVLYSKDKTQLLQLPRNSSITSFSIPNGVEYVAVYAIANNPNLTDVSVPSSVEELGSTDISSPFINCDNLQKIQVSLENANYSSDENGVLYNKSKTYLLQFPSGSELDIFTVPQSVMFCYPASFDGCRNLTKVDLGHVHDISNDTFVDCKKLKEITIPESVTRIGPNALRNSPLFSIVNFKGNETEWSQIEILSGNEAIKKAEIHFANVVSTTEPVTTVQTTTEKPSETTTENITETTTEVLEVIQPEPKENNDVLKTVLIIIAIAAVIACAVVVAKYTFKKVYIYI